MARRKGGGDDGALDLVQMGDIAEMLNVSRQRADQIINDERTGFPPPLGEMRTGRVWRRSAIARWLETSPWARERAKRQAPRKATRKRN